MADDTATIERELTKIDQATSAITASTATIRLELAPPEPEPAPLPVRARLIIPADYKMDAGPMAYLGRCDQWLDRMSAFLDAHAGKHLSHDLNLHRSKFTLLELQTGEGGDAGKIYRDQYGQGIWETAIWEKVFRGELGLGSEIPGANVYRWIAFVLGAGGWAGGRHNSQNPNHPLDDNGSLLIGHWQLEANVTKKNDDACIAYYGDPPIPSDHSCASDGGAFSHEYLHMLNVHCHGGNLMGDGTTLVCSSYPLDATDQPHPDKRRLTPAQAAEVHQYNQRFLT